MRGDPMMPALDDVLDRVERYHANDPQPRGEIHAAELDGLAAALMWYGLHEGDTAVRWCKMMAADARR